MKLYSVKRDYLYGDDKEVKRSAQVQAVRELGLIEENDRVVCTAEQAIQLMKSGYCGDYTSPDRIELVAEIVDKVNIESIIETCVSNTVAAIGRLFNDKCNQEQPGPNLMKVNETFLMEDACTDALQNKIDEGWRILAVCPQPQRRPDYVLGRSK